MFIPFQNNLSTELPPKFTFPFYYSPHPIALEAVGLLQDHLKSVDFQHDFGIGSKHRKGAIGKMFGVLVVESQGGQLGYIAAFSGKLGNSNHHDGFVPPVFDLLDPSGFFRKEEIEVNDLTLELHRLEKNEAYLELKNEVEDYRMTFSKWIEDEKAQLKQHKKQRQEKRDAANQQDHSAYQLLIEDLKEESIRQQIQFKQGHYSKKVVLNELEE